MKVIPTKEELARLSQLYNLRRRMQLTKKDLEYKLNAPVRNLQATNAIIVEKTVGKQLREVQQEIKDLKTKLRLPIEWELWRNDIK